MLEQVVSASSTQHLKHCQAREQGAGGLPLVAVRHGAKVDGEVFTESAHIYITCICSYVQPDHVILHLSCTYA